MIYIIIYKNIWIYIYDILMISWYADNYYDNNIEEKEWIIIRKVHTGIDYEDD